MTELPAWVSVLATFLAFVIGGGTVGPWLASKVKTANVAEMEKALSPKFAQVHEVNGLRGAMEDRIAKCCDRAEQAISGARLAQEVAEKALDLAQETRTIQGQFQERMAAEFFIPMRDLATNQQKQGEAIAAATMLLKRLTEQFDNLDRRIT